MGGPDVPYVVRQQILHHHLSGRSCREIALLALIPESTVNRLIERYRDTGDIHAKRFGNTGPRPLLSLRDERALARATVENPKLTARELRVSVGGKLTSVSIATVKWALRRQGRIAYRPRKSPGLNAGQRQTRLNWCRQLQNQSKEQWRMVCQFYYPFRALT